MDPHKYFEIIPEAGTLILNGDLSEQDKDHFSFLVSIYSYPNFNDLMKVCTTVTIVTVIKTNEKDLCTFDI